MYKLLYLYQPVEQPKQKQQRQHFSVVCAVCAVAGITVSLFGGFLGGASFSATTAPNKLKRKLHTIDFHLYYRCVYVTVVWYTAASSCKTLFYARSLCRWQCAVVYLSWCVFLCCWCLALVYLCLCVCAFFRFSLSKFLLFSLCIFRFLWTLKNLLVLELFLVSMCVCARVCAHNMTNLEFAMAIAHSTIANQIIANNFHGIPNRARPTTEDTGGWSNCAQAGSYTKRRCWWRFYYRHSMHSSQLDDYIHANQPSQNFHDKRFAIVTSLSLITVECLGDHVNICWL